MLLDLQSLYTGPPGPEPTPPPVEVVANPSGGFFWVGGHRIRSGEKADEEVIEVLLLEERKRR